MNDIIREIEAAQLKENVADFNVGDTVKVYAKIKEGNRERIQVFEGLVIKKQADFSKSDSFATTDAVVVFPVPGAPVITIILP